MGALTDNLSREHRHCDDLLISTELGIRQQDWETAALRYQEFSDATLRHFTAEERILFPAFEQATGSTAGPTSVMRSEHQQIREILASLDTALAGRNAEDFYGLADTLNIMLQQHNMKEEGILYPMAERMLPQLSDDLLEAMNHMDATA